MCLSRTFLLFVFCFVIQAMIFKMKKHFLVYVFLVTLFCKDCYACFIVDSENERSIATGTTFYEECCCTEPNHTSRELKWLDHNNVIIGPGTDSNVYIEDSGADCLSLHIRSTSVSLSGLYKCVANFNGGAYTQIHNLYVYEPLYFFNETKPDQYLVQGKDTMIRCEARGATTPLIKWTRGEDGQNEISNSEKYEVTDGGLIVKNVIDEDAGIYKCTASVMSTGEELEIDIDVKVMTSPNITDLTALPENTVTEKQNLVIDCQADGYPYPEYSWKKISELKEENETRNARWYQKGNTIIFNTVVADDTGIYECFAYNFAGNDSKTIEIKVLVPPTIIGFSNKTVIEGAEIAMVCNATGIPPPNITITYEGKSLMEEQTSVYTQFINNYSILKVDKSKEGTYICNATNEAGFETQEMYLTVHHAPEFDRYEEIVWGWKGETTNLYCDPVANPPANITWRYLTMDMEDQLAQEVSEVLKDLEDPHNISVRISDNFAPYGAYECKATNILGDNIKIIYLAEGHKPSKVLNVSVDDTLATSATFTIESPYNFSGPEVLGFMAEYDTNESYSITNIHPNRTWAAGITYKLEGLKPNNSYLIKFAAVNNVGTGEWSDTLEFNTLEKSIPEPPIWVTESLDPLSNNVLKWKKPEDNGAPIDRYTLRYCAILEYEDEDLCTRIRVERGTEIELTNLQYNTTYNFEIVAHNSEGDSMPANTTIFIPAYVEAAESLSVLSGGAIIGISVVIVLVCLLLLDLLLLLWRRQGIIASCCYKKNKKKPNTLNSRDKKGLLKDNGESTDDTLRRPNNGHREYEYNKTTGIITGKHSSV